MSLCTLWTDESHDLTANINKPLEALEEKTDPQVTASPGVKDPP